MDKDQLQDECALLLVQALEAPTAEVAQIRFARAVTIIFMRDLIMREHEHRRRLAHALSKARPELTEPGYARAKEIVGEYVHT